VGYARNADAHKRVMRKHQAANDALRAYRSDGHRHSHPGDGAWADVIKIGEADGYRNAQASVIAPTGTIGFMMDCDTTGIEPDLLAGQVQEAGRWRVAADRQPDHSAGIEEARLRR
jgi:ribonucleoside-diphosphate reductase alpha chain